MPAEVRRNERHGLRRMDVVQYEPAGARRCRLSRGIGRRASTHTTGPTSRPVNGKDIDDRIVHGRSTKAERGANARRRTDRARS